MEHPHHLPHEHIGVRVNLFATLHALLDTSTSTVCFSETSRKLSLAFGTINAGVSNPADQSFQFWRRRYSSPWVAFMSCRLPLTHDSNRARPVLLEIEIFVNSSSSDEVTENIFPPEFFNHGINIYVAVLVQQALPVSPVTEETCRCLR